MANTPLNNTDGSGGSTNDSPDSSEPSEDTSTQDTTPREDTLQEARDETRDAVSSSPSTDTAPKGDDNAFREAKDITRDSTARGDTTSDGVETGDGDVSKQARDFEQEVIDNTPGVSSREQVAIQRDGDRLRAELTDSGQLGNRRELRRRARRRTDTITTGLGFEGTRGNRRAADSADRQTRIEQRAQNRQRDTFEGVGIEGTQDDGYTLPDDAGTPTYRERKQQSQLENAFEGLGVEGTQDDRRAPRAGLSKQERKARQAIQEAEQEAETGQYTLSVAGHDFTIGGQARDVEPTVDDDGSVSFESRERAGISEDVDWSLGLGDPDTDEVEDTVRGVNNFFVEKAAGISEHTTAETDGIEVGTTKGLFSESLIAEGLEAAGYEAEADALESTGRKFVEGSVQGVASLPAIATGIPLAAMEGAETIGTGTKRTLAGEGDEFVSDLGDAAAGALGSAASNVAANPAGSAGLVAGSLVGSAGAFRAARAVGPRTSTATRWAIQPGEEAIGRGGFAATKKLRGETTAQKYFPNKEPLIFSEEAAIRAGKRGSGAAKRTASKIRERFDTDTGTLTTRTTSRDVFGSPLSQEFKIASDPQGTRGVWGRPLSNEFDVKLSPDPGTPTTSSGVFGRPLSNEFDIENPPSTRGDVFGTPMSTEFGLEVKASTPSTSADVFGSPLSQEFKIASDPQGTRGVWGRPLAGDLNTPGVSDQATRLARFLDTENARTLYTDGESAFIERNPGATPLLTEYGIDPTRASTRVRTSINRLRYPRPSRQNTPMFDAGGTGSGDVALIDVEGDVGDATDVIDDLDLDGPAPDGDSGGGSSGGRVGSFSEVDTGGGQRQLVELDSETTQPNVADDARLETATESEFETGGFRTQLGGDLTDSVGDTGFELEASAGELQGMETPASFEGLDDTLGSFEQQFEGSGMEPTFELSQEAGQESRFEQEQELGFEQELEQAFELELEQEQELETTLFSQDSRKKKRGRRGGVRAKDFENPWATPGQALFGRSLFNAGDGDGE